MYCSLIKKILLVTVYLIIILLIPLFLDYLMTITTRRKRRKLMQQLATEAANKLKRPLIIFNDLENGVVYDQIDLSLDSGRSGKAEYFNGNIVEISKELADNSGIVFVYQTLEYVDDIDELMKQLERISGHQLYICALEKNSPRIWFDSRIKRIFDQPYYLPDTLSTISWTVPNNLQKRTSHFYHFILKKIDLN